MSCFALYRLPHADTCTLVEQQAGQPTAFHAYEELDGQQGFVIAPFQVSKQTPILLIRPDHTEQLPVECPASNEPPKVIAADSRRDSYAAHFADFHSHLQADRFKKLVLARHATITTECATHPIQLFWQACQRYPRLFISLVSMPDGSSWLTATPEILLEGADSSWRTIALAGTMQLEGDDLKGEGETARWSTKNIQEQRYVATYIANCLKQFSIDYKEEGPRTVRAANLVHLRSDFTFTLPGSMPLGRLLTALHPTPAVCGLPKDDAYRFITTHEQADRAYYSGFMGPINLADTHLYVSLRCMHINGCEHTLYAGGGLLKDSIEEQEWAETEAKMQTMRSLFQEDTEGDRRS